MQNNEIKNTTNSISVEKTIPKNTNSTYSEKITSYDPQSSEPFTEYYFFTLDHKEKSSYTEYIVKECKNVISNSSNNPELLKAMVHCHHRYKEETKNSDLKKRVFRNILVFILIFCFFAFDFFEVEASEWLRYKCNLARINLAIFCIYIVATEKIKRLGVTYNSIQMRYTNIFIVSFFLIMSIVFDSVRFFKTLMTFLSKNN